MAATMSSELDNTDQLKVFFDDAQSKLNGIRFLPPDVNESFYRFIPNAQKQIRYALGAIKGTGEAAVNAIVAARESGGKFTDLFDFCERVGKQHANRRVLEALIRGGAFDSIEPNRAMLLGNIDFALAQAEQKADNANQGGLFDMVEDALADVPLQYIEPWNEATKLAEEKQAIGFYLSGHPFAPYASEVRAFAPTPLGSLKAKDGTQRLAGFATSIRSIMTKNGKMIALLLEDDTAKQEVIIRSDLLDGIPKETLKADQILICDCTVREDRFNPDGGLRVNVANIGSEEQKQAGIHRLNEARSRFAISLTLNLRPEHDIAALAQLLRPHTQATGNKIPLIFTYANERAHGTLLPNAQWRLVLSNELLDNLVAMLGERAVATRFR